MSSYILRLIGKWLSVIILSILSINHDIKDISYDVINSNFSKKINSTASVVEYKVINHYDKSIPNNIKKNIVEGKNGLIFKDESGEVVVLEETIDEENIVGTGKNGIYKGVMTGYGPDCKTCSGRGYVACRTREKKDFNLINDGIYYNDEEFGEVRVMAAALAEFPCGTIIEVDSKNLGQFTGIVLDTGYDMRRNLERGIYHFDIAYTTEKDSMVSKTTDMSGNVKYSVQRWGW